MTPLLQIDSLREVNRSFTKGASSHRLQGIGLFFVVVVVLLVGYGLVVVWAATESDADYNFKRQLAGVAVGGVLMALLWHFDYRKIAGMSTFFLIISVLLILSPHIPFIGVEAKGAQSWIKIGVQLQPGEFAKITVMLFAASLMARYEGRLYDPREYLKALCLLLVPFLCIMTQPDLGTGLVYLFIAATALIMGGARPKYLFITLAVGVVAIVALFIVDEYLKYETSPGVYEYRLLKQYQRNRLLVFLNPDFGSTDEGWNLRQAQTAIGSGGVFGKGLLNATQSSHGFLPEAPTDFIFCVLAEALGFFGVTLLLGLYVLLILLCFRIAKASHDSFGMLVVMCVVGMWLFQILENIGMTCGLMPITGIPLPFMSYGSSFMIVNFVMLGFIGSVWSHNNLQRKKGGYAITH